MGTARLSAVILAATLAACGGSSTSGPATNFSATLSGANESPATTSTATGTATYSLSGTTLTYTVTYTGLSGPPTGAHIHVAATGFNGKIIVPFATVPSTTAGTFSGTITAADITPQTTPIAVATFDDLLVQLRAGNTYTNIHTTANTGGEIRGQNIGH